MENTRNRQEDCREAAALIANGAHLSGKAGVRSLLYGISMGVETVSSFDDSKFNSLVMKATDMLAGLTTDVDVKGDDDPEGDDTPTPSRFVPVRACDLERDIPLYPRSAFPEVYKGYVSPVITVSKVDPETGGFLLYLKGNKMDFSLYELSDDVIGDLWGDGIYRSRIRYYKDEVVDFVSRPGDDAISDRLIVISGKGSKNFPSIDDGTSTSTTSEASQGGVQ